MILVVELAELFTWGYVVATCQRWDSAAHLIELLSREAPDIRFVGVEARVPDADWLPLYPLEPGEDPGGRRQVRIRMSEQGCVTARG